VKRLKKSRDFGKLILVAFVIAAPLAWYAVNLWLQDYTYKTQIVLTIYLLAGGPAFTIALLTIVYQSIRAATTDPVKSLKNE